jgi:Ras-related protein Rab-1A
MSRQDFDYLFKLVVIGDAGVGKSSILLRFADDFFSESYLTTIGVDLRFRTISVDGKKIKLQIWDTAGQERFKTMTSAYYRGSEGVLVVYDPTDRNSFDHVDTWLTDVKKFTGKAATLLVSSKCDLNQEKIISTEEGKAKANALGFDEFFEVSAKEGTNIETAFTALSKILLKVKQQRDQAVAGLSDDRVTLRTSVTAAESSSKCCQ